MAAALSSCDTINNLAGSEIANVITENVTEQITMRTNADPDAVAAAASSLASALTISNNEIIALCEEHMMEMDTTNIILPDDDPYTERLGRVMSRFKNLGSMRLNYAVYDDESTVTPLPAATAACVSTVASWTSWTTTSCSPSSATSWVTSTTTTCATLIAPPTS